MIEITERFLSDAGGWQALKQARALHEMGRVLSASYAPPLLQGIVREGELELRSGLKILSKSNVENLCTCRESRRNGTICAHALAVGLEILKPRTTTAPAPAPLRPVEAKPADRGPAFSTETGEPLEIFVILPANFASAWERNSVMVGVEAAVAGRRALLSALDPKRTYRATGREVALIAHLRTLDGGALPGMLILPREAFIELLPVLAGHPRITFGKASAAQVSDAPLRPRLVTERRADGSLSLGVVLPEISKVLVAGPNAWLLEGPSFRPLASGLPPAYLEVLQREIVLPAEAADQFLQREIRTLGFAFELAAEIAVPPTATPEFQKSLFALFLEGSLNHLTARIEARYGDFRVTLDAAGQTGGTPVPLARGIRRDRASEAAALERLGKAGFTSPDRQGQLVLKGEPAILAFFARDLPRLQRDWTVTIGERFEHVTRDIERIQPHLEIRSSGENWFDLSLDLTTADGTRFSAAEMQRLLQSGQSSTRLKNRKLAVFDPGMLDEFQQALVDCDPRQPQPGLYRIARPHAVYLDALAKEQGAAVQADARWQSWTEVARSPDRLPQVPLGDLESVLRPYQKTGVYWLKYLSSNGLAGIIADEMGLGKTVQALAFLRLLGGRALIVCPSSLIFNWAREAARFTPERKVLVVQGADRQKLFGDPMRDAHLVITSYPLLRRDIEQYRGWEFSAAVLDEAQHIKNPESQNAQAACALRAQHRFLLTGTPIENSIKDLWSLMHFLMPGYLGTAIDFRERFEREIQNDPVGPAAKRLMKRIQPFVLRRLKSSVATEIPDKLEQVSYCELTEEQKTAYAELVKGTRRTLSELSGSKDQNKARIVMLTALLRLRQACCDLRLLGLPEAAEGQSSAKIDLLKELLAEAIDGGHRVLIFSQFVSMLHLLRTALDESEIPFCYLDGATKDRAAEVDRFQTGEIPTFLISLKAGGVGLNLTAADTVIHFDPWWNPAVENQATDRAHRIGQNKVVTVYKLIARDTVEEKILALQQRKRALVEATLESEQPLMEGLTMGEIEEMLA